jgi:hypothetical protein
MGNRDVTMKPDMDAQEWHSQAPKVSDALT